MDAVTIIAEAGVNHNGNYGLATKLIDAAAKSGADFVKFQMFSAEKLVTKSAPKADYQAKNTGSRTSQFDMLKGLELSQGDHLRLNQYAREKGIDYLATAFDVENLNFLSSQDSRLIKIPSGEITNPLYLKAVGAANKKVLLSTGMATLLEIEAALNLLCSSGCCRQNITLLHCTTEYPAPFKEVNLNAIKTLKSVFGLQVGYSDHTEGIEVAIAAVALGATVVEKHFTLDKDMEGPDHKASMEPDELNELVRAVRNIEAAMGDGVKQATPSEQKNLVAARRSIVAACKVKKGERFTAQNLTCKRPGNGISPMRIGELFGMRASKDFEPDDMIEL